jgi:hypothetical protein
MPPKEIGAEFERLITVPALFVLACGYNVVVAPRVIIDKFETT